MFTLGLQDIQPTILQIFLTTKHLWGVYRAWCVYS